MFTVRNLGGIALFLFGTTFLWLTPAFASKDISTDDVLWFGHPRHGSSHHGRIPGSHLGTLSTGFLVGARGRWFGRARTPDLDAVLDRGREVWREDPAFTVFVEFLGIAGVFVLLLVPKLEQWVDSHVMGS